MDQLDFSKAVNRLTKTLSENPTPEQILPQLKALLDGPIPSEKQLRVGVSLVRVRWPARLT
jgi:hypothetical protein